MSQSASSQPRRRSRGGRNRQHTGGPREHYNHDNHTFKRPSTPAKKSFFQRLLAFFGFGPKKPVRPERPERPERPTRNDSVRSPAGATGRKASESRPREARPAREPRPVVQHEVTSGRLYIGNLSYEVAESDLLNLFGGIGQVRSAEVVCHRHNQRSKGYAFVEMLSIDDAKRAVRELHDKEFLGRKMLVSGAKSATSGTGDERAPNEPRDDEQPDEPTPTTTA